MLAIDASTCVHVRRPDASEGEARVLRVGMMVMGDANGRRLPFPDDWADAATHGAAVTRFQVGGRSTPGIYVVPRVSLRPSRHTHRLSSRIAGARVARALEWQRLDVLHGHFYTAAEPLLTASKRLGVPLVVTEHSSRLTGSSARHKPLTSAGLRLAKTIYANATVIAVSQYLADCIAERTGIMPIVIGNPVDVDLFRPRTRSNDIVNIVFVGRIEADKDPDLLVRGFDLASSRDERLRLTIIGDGPGLTRLRAAADERVTFTGRIPRESVARHVGGSHVMVSTSTVETFAVAAAEGAAAGLPVVCPKQQPFDEVITNGNIAFEPGSAESLSVAINKAANGRFDRESIRQSIVERFSPRNIGAQLQQIYEKIA